MSGSGEDLDDLLAGLDEDGPEEDKPRRGLTSLLDDLDDSPAASPDLSVYEPLEEGATESPTVMERPPSAGNTPHPERRTPLTLPPEPGPAPAAPLPPAPSAAVHDDPDAAAAAVAQAQSARDPLATLRAQHRRKPRTLLWVGLISFAVAGLGAVLYTQSDAFHPERSETRRRIAESQKERALAEHRAEQPVAGTVVIESSEPEAAVWVLLGRTPLESFELSANQVHEVRFELEGYQGLDAVIARPDWSEVPAGLRGEKVVRLRPGAAELPPYPEEAAVRPAPGPKGRGRLVLDSEPAGSRVWLLIGFTPEVELSGVASGRSYLFKVLKKGFLPAFAEVDADDWVMEGPEVDKEVTLRPAPE